MLANPKILKIIDTQIKNGTAANQKNICAKVMPPDRHGLSATYPHTTIIGKSKKKKYSREWLENPGSATVSRNAIGNSQIGRKLRQ